MRVSETPVDTYGRFSVLAHDDAGVGAAEELTAVQLKPLSGKPRLHFCVLYISNYDVNDYNR
jgi:hypothetical protein